MDKAQSTSAAHTMGMNWDKEEKLKGKMSPCHFKNQCPGTFLLSIELSCSNTACCCIDDSRYMKKRRVIGLRDREYLKKESSFSLHCRLQE